jgi:regulator of sigma E protease
MTMMTLSFFKKMIFGELSAGTLMGPIGIAKVAGEVVQTGIIQFLTVLALMSLSLGIINLMPIPMLDGGMVLLNLIELIMGKPIPESLQVMGFQFGVLLIGGLFVFVTYNDLLRIF